MGFCWSLFKCSRSPRGAFCTAPLNVNPFAPSYGYCQCQGGRKHRPVVPPWCPAVNVSPKPQGNHSKTSCWPVVFDSYGVLMGFHQDKSWLVLMIFHGNWGVSFYEQKQWDWTHKFKQLEMNLYDLVGFISQRVFILWKMNFVFLVYTLYMNQCEKNLAIYRSQPTFYTGVS